MTTAPTILSTLDDPMLFAGSFRGKEAWEAWRVFLAALFALPMTDAEIELFKACTGRSETPAGRFTEAWLICGRRAGKSRVLALIAVYLATFIDWRPHLAPGERGTVLVLATDRRQARVIMRYCRGLLEEVPMLAALITGGGAEDIELSNRVTIEVATASYRAVRGHTLIAALLDEMAFWRAEDSANPDTEILDALRPAMATIPGAMLLAASSPYSKRGVLWDAYRTMHGRNDAPALVWRAATRTMNPTVPQAFIDRAYERDPSSAAAEFGAEFRSDIEAFLTREVIDAATVLGRVELPPVSDVRYHAFVDPSGGSADSFTLAIAHFEADRAILDLVRERRPPFSPESVVAEFASTLAPYRIKSVIGDRYAGEWTVEAFSKVGIEYRQSAKPKSDLYGALLPAINSGRVELLDLPRLHLQLLGLERRTARGGRDSIDHAPGAHDDIANVAAGALGLCVNTPKLPGLIAFYASLCAEAA